MSVGKDGNSFANPDWQGSFQAIEDGAKGGTSTSSMLGTLPFFILICVFLALSIIAADKLGMEGGSKAVSLGRSFANRVRKTAVNNSAGFALRGVNWASDKAQGGYERLDAGMSTSRTGRLLRGAATVATLGALSDKSIRSTFEAGKKLSIDSSETADDVAKRNRERTGRQSQALGEMEREGNMDNFNSAIDSTATTAQELQDAFSGLGRTIRQMSNEERNDLGYDKLTSARVAMNLSDAHIESLEKSGNFSYQQIQNIKNARTQAHVSVANGGVHPRTTDPTAANYNADMARHNVLPAGRQLANQGEMEDFQNRQRESLISRDIKAAGNMDMDVFTNADMSVHLTPQALEERIRNGGVGEAQRNTIRNNIITQVNSDLASNNPSEVARGQRQANMWNTWSNGTSGSGARFGLQFNVPQAQPAQAAGGAPNAAQQRQQNQQARQARANAARNNRNRPGP